MGSVLVDMCIFIVGPLLVDIFIVAYNVELLHALKHAALLLHGIIDESSMSRAH